MSADDSAVLPNSVAQMNEGPGPFQEGYERGFVVGFHHGRGHSDVCEPNDCVCPKDAEQSNGDPTETPVYQSLAEAGRQLREILANEVFDFDSPPGEDDGSFGKVRRDLRGLHAHIAGALMELDEQQEAQQAFRLSRDQYMTAVNELCENGHECGHSQSACESKAKVDRLLAAIGIEAEI